MPLDPRWHEVFAPYATDIAHYFKVWTLDMDAARTFQRHQNAQLTTTQPARYMDDIDNGDYRGVALAMTSISFNSVAPETALRLLREAVELLDVLAHADLTLWREVMAAPFGLKERWCARLVPVWLFVPFDMLTDDVNVATARVGYFFETLQQQPRSATYHAALRHMHALLGDTLATPQSPLDMTLLVSLPKAIVAESPSLGAHLSDVADIVDTACADMQTHTRVPIRVTAVKLELGRAVVDADGLAGLAALSAVTAMASLDMTLMPAKHDRGVHPYATFGRFLQHVALDCRPLWSDSPRHIGVNLVHGDARRFVAVCSAVQASTCVSSFGVQAEDVDWPRSVWLRWLAWSWLDTEDHDRTDWAATLAIDELSVDDVAVLADVLAGGHPWCGPATRPLEWCVVTRAVVVSSWSEDPASRETLMIPKGTRVAVADDETSATQVRLLIPGIGVACIDRATACASTQSLPFDPSSRRVRVTSLHLIVTGTQPTNLAGAVALVELLGRTLTALQLVMENQTLACAHVVRILECCPRLETLKLSGLTLADLDVVASVFNDPSCRLVEVVLLDLRLTTVSGLRSLLTALSTPTTRIAQQLKVLGLSLTEDAMAEASDVEAVDAMLDRNRRLKTCHVRFPKRLEPREFQWRYSTSIARAAYAVPLRQKLALLSGLRASPLSASARVLSAVGVLAHVFEFAAQQTYRDVYVGYGLY